MKERDYLENLDVDSKTVKMDLQEIEWDGFDRICLPHICITDKFR